MKKTLMPLIIIALSIVTVLSVSAVIVDKAEVMKKIDSVNAVINNTAKSKEEVDAAIKEGKQVMKDASDNNLLNIKDDISKEDLLFSISSYKSAFNDIKQSYTSDSKEDKKMLANLDNQIKIIERLEKRVQKASDKQIYPLYLRYKQLSNKMKATLDIPSEASEIVDSEFTSEELSVE